MKIVIKYLNIPRLSVGFASLVSRAILELAKYIMVNHSVQKHYIYQEVVKWKLGILYHDLQLY